MKHFVKNLYSVEADNPTPIFMGQREQIDCIHCGKRMIIAVPVTGTDWEKVAKDYKAHADQMWLDLNTLLVEEGVKTLLYYKVEQLMRQIQNNFGKTK